MIGWLMVLPVAGLGWWALGFPFAPGWAVAPMNPTMPVTPSDVVVLGTVVIGLYGGLAWLRHNL